jgi:hypothetical protein
LVINKLKIRIFFANPHKNAQKNRRSAVERFMTKKVIAISCYASKLNTETGSPARPTIIVEKLTIKLDAQQLSSPRSIWKFSHHPTQAKSPLPLPELSDKLHSELSHFRELASFFEH